MSRLTQAATYDEIKQITDWQLSEDNQRSALAVVVNAIASLDTSQRWGQGKTSASDGQRFAFRRRVLHQTYSPKFSDFALEFYSLQITTLLSTAYQLNAPTEMLLLFWMGCS
jgi:TnpA family transposase